MLKYMLVVCLLLSACRARKTTPSGGGADEDKPPPQQTQDTGENVVPDQKPPVKKPLDGTKTEGVTSSPPASEESSLSLNGLITKRLGQFLFVSSDLKGVCGRGKVSCTGGGQAVCFLSQRESRVEKQVDSYKKSWAGTSSLLRQSRVLCVKNHSTVERVFPSCEDGTQPVCGFKRIDISSEYRVACTVPSGENGVFRSACLYGQPVCNQQGRYAYCANEAGYVFSDEPVPVGMQKRQSKYALRCEKSGGEAQGTSSPPSQTESEPYCVKNP